MVFGDGFFVNKNMNRKTILIGLAIIGFALPNYFVIQESMDSGNIMLYSDPAATFSSLFANRISSIFALDLLFVVMVFFGWSFWKTPAVQRPKMYGIWAITMLFGLASGFPLFLLLQEQQKE